MLAVATSKHPSAQSCVVHFKANMWIPRPREMSFFRLFILLGVVRGLMGANLPLGQREKLKLYAPVLAEAT